MDEQLPLAIEKQDGKGPGEADPAPGASAVWELLQQSQAPGNREFSCVKEKIQTQVRKCLDKGPEGPWMSLCPCWHWEHWRLLFSQLFSLWMQNIQVPVSPVLAARGTAALRGGDRRGHIWASPPLPPSSPSLGEQRPQTLLQT